MLQAVLPFLTSIGSGASGILSSLGSVLNPLSSLGGSGMFGGGSETSSATSTASGNNQFAPIYYNAGVGGSADNSMLGIIVVAVGVIVLFKVFGKKKRR
jgi:hypothetical protein